MVTLFGVSSLQAYTLKSDSIVSHLLPSLKTYVEGIENASQYTPEKRAELKDQLHKDLLHLKDILQSEKDFADLEKQLFDLIDSPDAISGLVGKVISKYGQK